jgi:hypothetical protein
MTTAVPVITSHASLLEAAKVFFAEHYEEPDILYGRPVDDRLGWEPSIHFRASDHLIIAVELSDTPYPTILRLRHADLINLPVPIAVHCVCPEEAFLSKEAQADVKLLQSHGYGLITVNKHGTTMQRFACIPLIQHIPEQEFRAEIEELPKQLRLRARDAFNRYRTDPVSGLQDLSEMMEGLIYSAAKRAATKGWITQGMVKSSSADILDALATTKECKPAAASLGGVRAFVKQYRNASHHFPKSKQEALQKYRSAPLGFRHGLTQIKAFRESMGDVGLRVSL